jgi:hypothetical protein
MAPRVGASTRKRRGPTARTTPNGRECVYKSLQLSLDDKFFKTVREELRRWQAIEVKTPYENVERVPEIIRNFFALRKSRLGAVVDPKSGKFIPNTTTSFSHKHAGLKNYGSAATGGVVGMFRPIIERLPVIGRRVRPSKWDPFFAPYRDVYTGFTGGMSASAFVHGGYEISLVVVALGTLTVRIRPVW